MKNIFEHLEDSGYLLESSRIDKILNRKETKFKNINNGSFFVFSEPL